MLTEINSLKLLDESLMGLWEVQVIENYHVDPTPVKAYVRADSSARAYELALAGRPPHTILATYPVYVGD